MSSAFQLLSRGLHFNKKRFQDEAKTLGLLRKHEEPKEEKEIQSPPVTLPTKLPTKLPTPPESTEVSSEDDQDKEEEQFKLTLLDDIKVKGKGDKKGKDKKKRSKKKLRLIHTEKVNQFRNANRIHVSGEDVPEPVDDWEKLKNAFAMPDNLVDSIRKVYPQPTPIQMQAIPCMMERRELLACAPTGSGKTAAFLIPLVHLLKEPKKGGVRAVILAPTRELAQQIQRETARLSECRGLRSLVLDPAVNKASKNFDDAASQRWDILVATPNRLVYMLNEGKLSLPKVEWLIVDESDKLFESGTKGFRDQLAVVYKACDQAEGGVRRAMFSATLAVDVEQWCKLNLDNVLSVTIGERNTTTTTIEQKLVYASTEKGKMMALQNLVAEGIKPPVLIFVQTKDRAKDLYKEMKDVSKFDGTDLHVDVIHSDRSELQRDASIKSFRSGRVWMLICTELLGRGIDFKGVNLVINYDFPQSVFAYIHRIGRTGRAGRSGKAVTFFTDADKTLLRSVAQVVKSAGGDVPDYIFTLKKATRQEKRRLAKRAVERESIIPESKWDKGQRLQRTEMIDASKKRKRKNEEEAKSGKKAPKEDEPAKKKSKKNKLKNKKE